jgi:predicted nucleic acid-binding protein
MIVVDTSVWIGHLRGHDALPHVRWKRAAFGQEFIVVGDLIMLEVRCSRASPTKPAPRRPSDGCARSPWSACWMMRWLSVRHATIACCALAASRSEAAP